MSFYAFIPHIKAQGANLHTSGILLGGAPLMASSLFAHHLARQLGVQDEGVIYIHHDRQDLGGFAYGRFTPAQRRGSVFLNKNDYSSKNPNALSLQPTASCHLHFSLVIRFNGKRKPRISQLKDLLNTSRFAGGQIIEFGDVEFVEEKEFVNRLSNTIQTGFVLIDRQDVLVHFQQIQQLNRLQAFTQLLALNKYGLENYFGKNHQLSFLSATNLGYALLESPNNGRTGVRQAYTPANHSDGGVMPTPHAFAEPLIGLVQYVSLRQLINLSKIDNMLDNADNADTDNQPINQEVSPNPIAKRLSQFADDLHRLFWRYKWQSHDGGDVFLLNQSFTQNL